MVQYPRHAVVEFHPDWAIKSWHCVLCGSQCDSQEQLKSHLQFHEIKDVIATVITTGNLQNGAAINFKHSFITDSTADVSISTGDVAAHVKKEINDSDDYMPLEEVESDNESFGAKLEPNDDDSEIPEFKIEAVHSDDNEMETSFTYDENANSPEEAIKFNCNYCDKSFDTKPKLERHQKLNHEVLVCPVRNCTQKLVDVNHIMKHSTISPRFKSQRVAQTATKTSLSAGQSSQDEKSSVPVLPPEKVPEAVDSESSVDSTIQLVIIQAEPPEPKAKSIKSEKSSFICHHCGNAYREKHHFTEHVRKKHLNQYLLCHICGEKVRVDSSRKRHFVDMHKGPKSFSCKVCGTSYGSWRTMHEHQVSVHNYNAMAVCRLCVKGFNTTEEKDLHEMTFHPGLPESNELLIKYVDRYFIEKDGKLVLCKYGQLGKNDVCPLTENEERIETIDDIFFQPPIQETREEKKKKYAEARKRKRESMKRGSSKDNQIDKAGLMPMDAIVDTKIPTAAAATAAVHVLEDDNDCNVVLKFDEGLPRKNYKRAKLTCLEVRKLNAELHKIKKSVLIRNVKCDHCDEMFTSKTSQRQHKRAVHDQLVFLCHVCGKAHKAKNNMKKHFVHGHKGPMEFECKRCSLSFPTWPIVYHHLREVHGFDKLAICRLCAGGFSSAKERDEHEKEHHPLLPDFREDLLEHANQPFFEESPGKYVLSNAYIIRMPKKTTIIPIKSKIGVSK